MLPPIVVQLIAAIVGEIFRQVLTNLPALEAGLREIHTGTAEEAKADPALSEALAGELSEAIGAGEVPAP
jgi:hypothetical protein